MAKKTLIENASILNEGQNRRGSVLIEVRALYIYLRKKSQFQNLLRNRLKSGLTLRVCI
jgi:hypothetical protein